MELIDIVATEMNGWACTLLATHEGFAKGATVRIKDWQRTMADAALGAKDPSSSKIIKIPKRILDPILPQVKGIRRYTLDVAEQQNVVEKSLQAIQAQKAVIMDHENAYKSYDKVNNTKGWTLQMDVLKAELQRRQKQHTNRETNLSRMLVRQTMYNRFDQIISDWVAYYSKQLSPAQVLDPNIVKSMTFEESRMGTFGLHLQLPPYGWDPEHHYFKTRFNIIQAIDSAEEQQLLIIEEMSPSLFKKHRLDQLQAEHRQKGLKRTGFYTWKNQAFLSAIVEFFTTRDKSKNNLMGNPVDLHEDYAFWLRTAIRWLFYKYQLEKKWNEAIRAYNGTGVAARNYRDRVLKRVGSDRAFDATE